MYKGVILKYNRWRTRVTYECFWEGNFKFNRGDKKVQDCLNEYHKRDIEALVHDTKKVHDIALSHKKFHHISPFLMSTISISFAGVAYWTTKQCDIHDIHQMHVGAFIFQKFMLMELLANVVVLATSSTIRNYYYEKYYLLKMVGKILAKRRKRHDRKYTQRYIEKNKQ